MNVIPNIFDKYERNARLYPTVLVLLPLLVAIATTVPTFEQSTITYAVAVIVLLAGAYAAMLIVRQCGRSIEPRVWESWGGPPSTRFLLWSDDTFTDDWKSVAHRTVSTALGINLLTREEEQQDAARAAKLVADSFAQVKSIIKMEKPEGDHQIHNIEYGFARNLLGSCPLAIGLAIAATAWCAFFWWWKLDWTAATGCALSVLAIAVFVVAQRIWLPAAAQLAADRYAEKAWTTFVELRRAKSGAES